MSNIPQHFIEAFARYVDHHIKPGSFLTACLQNDLREAFGQADIHSRYMLFDIVSYMYNEIPCQCWGSKEAVTEWLKKRKVPT